MLLVTFLLAAPGCERPPLPVVPPPDEPLPPEGPPVLHATDSPAAVLDRALEVLGGPERLARWKCGRVKYETRSDLIPLLGKRPSVVEEYFQLPGQLKRIAEIGEGARRQNVTFVINGPQGWEYRPDGSTRPVTGDALLAALRPQHAFADFCNLARLRDPAFRLSVLGEDRVNGRSVVVLHSEAPLTNPTDYALDRSTALLLKSTKHLPQPKGGEKTIETLLGNYRDIGGGQVPLHVVGRSDGKVLLDFTLLEVEFLDHLDDSVFPVPE
jgi:hypothetical protein